MMTAGLQLILMGFALVGFAGAGTSLAVVNARGRDGDRDAGMIAVAALLFVFGTLCATAAGGLLGVLAFGGVATWVAYVVTAQRMGMFRIETGGLEETQPAEPRQRT
jgi:hypothetical protein